MIFMGFYGFHRRNKTSGNFSMIFVCLVILSNNVHNFDE